MFHLQIVSTVESAQRNFRFLQFHKGRTNLTDMIIPVDQKYIFFWLNQQTKKQSFPHDCLQVVALRARLCKWN